MKISFSKLIHRPRINLHKAVPKQFYIKILSSPPKYCPRAHNLPGKLIVSLTSYSLRFDYLQFTIKSLLRQTVSPDKLILWLSKNDQRRLPKDVLNLQENGLTIAYAPDLKSYTKLVPALQEFPDAFIVTADDDLYYASTWLEKITSEYGGDDNVVICNRAHRIRLDNNNLPIPYKKWDYEGGTCESFWLNFPTSGAGILFPPHILHPSVLEIDNALNWCPTSDDVWFYWMFRLNGACAKVIKNRFPLIEWPSSRYNALWKKNNNLGQNDVAINAMCRIFGFIK